MAGYDLLVIDDFGLMDLNLDKCRDLFEIIEARDCRKSTVIISQMPVANWYQLFGDNTYADACLNRMTSKAYRLDFSPVLWHQKQASLRKLKKHSVTIH